MRSANGGVLPALDSAFVDQVMNLFRSAMGGGDSVSSSSGSNTLLGGGSFFGGGGNKAGNK